jgi:hypothetical protein
LPGVDVKAEENRIKQLLLHITEAIHRQDLEEYMKGFHKTHVLSP